MNGSVKLSDSDETVTQESHPIAAPHAPISTTTPPSSLNKDVAEAMRCELEKKESQAAKDKAVPRAHERFKLMEFEVMKKAQDALEQNATKRNIKARFSVNHNIKTSTTHKNKEQTNENQQPHSDDAKEERVDGQQQEQQQLLLKRLKKSRTFAH
jgi:hypothetical protein